MSRTRQTTDERAEDETRRRFAAAVEDPAIVAEVNRLLSGRTRDIRLRGTMRTLYQERNWAQTSQTVRSWMSWVLALDVFGMMLDFAFLPRDKAIQALVPGGIIMAAALAVITIWRGRAMLLAQELGLTAGIFVILFAIALVGVVSGPDLYLHCLSVMIFVAVTAIVIFGVSIAWSWVIAATALGLHAGFQLWNPLVSNWNAIAVAAFYGVGLAGTVLARRSITIVAQKSFLFGLRERQRVSELAEANRRLETLARTDPLTGVANRRWITETMEALWNEGAEAPKSVAVLMCDVDHFKGLNDAIGHFEGDRCLREVAHVICDCVRPGIDHVARYGGEEFLVLLPGVDVFDATLTAERICRTMEATLMPNPGSAVSRYVTLSIGVAVSTTDGTLSPERLQRRADEALYGAKDTGRNRVVVHGAAERREPGKVPALALAGPGR